MKKVFFVRHAKSSWSDFSLPDHDRPLNKRGRHDAPLMAIKVKELGLAIEAVLTSTALRAKSTAEHFADAMDVPRSNVFEIKRLYHSYPDTMIEQLWGLDSDINTAAIFAHNPGMTMAVNMVSDTPVDNVPTCGVFLVECDVKEWVDFDLTKCSMSIFLKPKEVL